MPLNTFHGMSTLVQVMAWCCQANVDLDVCPYMASLDGNELTPKHRETHGFVVSTVATDTLVLKHQAISIHNAD